MIPSWLQAVVLGLVQGLAEFIPVSSSGHLVLVPHLFGWERPGLAFDVALHMGTIGAIVLYFRRDLWAMLRGVLEGGRSAEGRLHRRLALLLVVGSAPVAVVGLTFTDLVEQAFATPLVAAGFLLVTALVLSGGERWRDRRVSAVDVPGVATGKAEASRPESGEGQKAGTVRALPLGHDPSDPLGRSLAQIGLRDALLVGSAQVLALFPGVSRSGTTIMAGVVAGLTRAAATRFSFLLALPALAGAGLVSLPDLREPDVYRGWEIGLGVGAAFLASYAAIAFLVAFVSTERLSVFAKYCVAASAVGFLSVAVRTLAA